MELLNYLKENNLSVSQFAELAKMKQVTVWRIVNKKVAPSAKSALEIEKATRGRVGKMELLYPKTS